MANDFISGISEGVKAGNDLMFGEQQAQAKTQLLSDKAQESQMALKVHQQEYGARMAIYSAEQAFAKQHSDSNIATLKGQADMLSKLADNPTIKNNPMAMDHLFQQKRANIKQQQEETKANLQMSVEKMQNTSDQLNRVLLNPDDPQGWKEIYDGQENPAAQMQIAKVQSYFTSDKYKSLPEAKKILAQRQILSHFETAKAKIAAAQGVSNTIIQSDRTDETARKDREKAQLDAQRIAALKEKTDAATKKASEKKDSDFIAQDARQRKELTGSVEKMETKQGEILSSLGLSNSKDKTGFVFKDGLDDHPAAKAAFNLLETQKSKRISDFNNYQLDVIRKQGKAPSSGPGSTKIDPVEVTSEAVANTMPKGVWVKLGDKVGQIQ